jgi:outer membrane protein, multidrug efflux system
MRARGGFALALALALGGCDLAPIYQPPAVALPSHYANATSGPANGFGLAAEWWRSFHDPELDRLEAQVDANNPDLAAALAAYEASNAAAAAATSGLYPELDAGGGLSANRQSDNRPLRSKTQPTYYGANQIYATVASYEIDIWGRVRDVVNAANATAQANQDLFVEAREELHAELARDYVDLRGLDAETKLLADTIDNYRSALQLTQTRLQAKIAPAIDEQRALNQLSDAQASASDLALRRTALVDAIADLTGAPAASYHIAAVSQPMAFPLRPRSTPGDVLRRRPDVAAAERDAAASSALIGAARASLYPKFTLGLLGGTQDTALRLLSPGNIDYTVGPSVSAPLFDFGLRKAQIEQAKAEFKIAAAKYRATVLRAVREVQDNLSALHWLEIESQQTDSAANAARTASDMSMALYRDGAASYLDVVTAQNAALAAERAAIALHSRQLQANVALMLALGGGWNAPPPTQTADLTASR